MKIKKTTVDAETAAAQENGGGGAYIATRFRNPADDDFRPSGTTTGEKVCAIIAIVSTLLLGAVCAMQYLQYAQ